MTNKCTQSFHKLSHSYMFRHYRIILRQSVINILPSYTSTGCGRNSELIINKNNILLKVTDTNFSTSQFTMVLNFLYIVPLFAYNVFHVATTLLNARVHTSYEGAHNSLKCLFLNLAISSRMFSLSARKPLGPVLYTLLLK